MGAPVDARAESRLNDESSQFDRPSNSGRQTRSGSGQANPARRTDAGRSERLQDTEFKLSDKRRKQKPKEPNRLLLAAALGLVVLVGVGVAFWLTRGGDETTSTESADPASAVETETETEAETTADTTDVTEAPVAEADPVLEVPNLFFEQAEAAPLVQGETYSIDLVGEPEGSLLQVIVDEIPQGEPDALLPDLILPAGRHSLRVEITNGAEVSSSTQVEVYVLGEPPVQGFRANLSSVDMQTEGWTEAIRQFDEYRAAGHENLQLSPITPGYWNIFVPGFGEDSQAPLDYCETFGLAVPDDCFAPFTEGSGAAPAAEEPAEDTTDTTVAESTDTESSDSESTDTTVAGG